MTEADLRGCAQEIAAEISRICRSYRVLERAATRACGATSLGEGALDEGAESGCPALTFPQGVALRALAEKNLDIGELGKALGSSQSAATRLADGLEKRGYIQRLRRATDRRRVELSLTDRGRAEAMKLSASLQGPIQSIFAALTPERSQEALSALRDVRQALEAARDAVLNCCPEFGDDA